MAKIVPAVLIYTVDDYVHQLRLAKQMTDRVQLDVIDGIFADNKTVSPTELTADPAIQLDVHLMVNHPKEFIAHVLHLEPSLIIIQYEVNHDFNGALKLTHEHEIKTGIGINPETSIKDIKDYLDQIDHLLIMSYPAGFAGQKFQPENLSKVRQIREIRPDVEIGLDGGVSDDNLEQIIDAGVDVINVNSFLFEAADPIANYQKLTEITRVN